MINLNFTETAEEKSGAENSPQKETEYHEVEEESEVEAMGEFMDETEKIKCFGCQRCQRQKKERRAACSIGD